MIWNPLRRIEERLSTIIDILEEILIEIPEPPRSSRGSIAWALGPAERKTQPMIEFTITNEQKQRLKVTPVTAAGNPAPVEPGSIVWTSDPNSDVTVDLTDGSGNTLPEGEAYIVSGSILGDATIQVSADADLGAGVMTIQDIALVHVQGAFATSLGLGVVGAPEPK